MPAWSSSARFEGDGSGRHGGFVTGDLAADPVDDLVEELLGLAQVAGSGVGAHDAAQWVAWVVAVVPAAVLAGWVDGEFGEARQLV